MPNNILPQGDDLKWKKEVDIVIEKLEARIQALSDQLKATS